MAVMTDKKNSAKLIREQTVIVNWRVIRWSSGRASQPRAAAQGGPDTGSPEIWEYSASRPVARQSPRQVNTAAPDSPASTEGEATYSSSTTCW
jgi:hypothetical protein